MEQIVKIDTLCAVTLFNIGDIPDKTAKCRIENAKIRLARRLARLTPCAVVTLFALCPGKHTGFHEIVEIITNSRFHVRNPRRSRRRRRLSSPPPRVARRTGHPRRATH